MTDIYSRAMLTVIAACAVWLVAQDHMQKQAETQSVVDVQIVGHTLGDAFGTGPMPVEISR